MRENQIKWFEGLLSRISLAKSIESVSAWCERELCFKEPGISPQFSLAGREYMREPLDNWGDPTITDQTCVWGARTGKTRVCYGGLAWTLAHEASRILFVKPTTKGTAGAEADSRNRFMPMIRASEALASMIPEGGNRRHEFKTLQQVLGGSIIDWVGSNSVAQLASNPMRIVVQDETDKFNAVRKRDEDGNVIEANASELADERCKEFSNPKRFKTSTPSVIPGLIWQSLLRSDFRRRFMPCPHCGRENSSRKVVLAWSAEFTCIPHTGSEAFVKWDDEARMVDGSWDLDRVERSARYVCPFCAGHIIDTHKSWMDRQGEWRATKRGDKGHRGYHLPSMYCSHKATNVGTMAVRFLKANESLDGPKGFINSDLAEPTGDTVYKVTRVERIVLESSDTSKWFKMLTVDCQQSTPHFYYVVRAWNGGGSELIEADSCDTWPEVEALQKRHSIVNEAVFVDCGYGRFEEIEVLKNCLAHSDIVDRPGMLPVAIGWQPTAGTEGGKVWRDQETGLLLPYHFSATDPLRGTADAKTVEMQILTFSADTYKDRLDSLRKQKTKFTWTVPEKAAPEAYWKHMDGEWRPPLLRRKKPRVAWEKRHRNWPNHWFDCEVLQIVAADFAGRFTESQPPTPPPNPNDTNDEGRTVELQGAC